MNLTQPVWAPQASSQLPFASQGETPDILTDIYQPAHNIVVWQNTLPSSLKKELNNFLPSLDSFQYSHTLKYDEAERRLREGLKAFPCAEALGQHMAELIDMFCCLFDLRQAGLRLTLLDRAMCPRFHVDHVPCRLVTTLSGIGTEWVEEAALDRAKLGAGNNGLPDHQSGLFSRSSAIHQASEGDVLLLKGERWEGNEGHGLVHRSPPVKEGEKRLLMTLDFSY